MVGMGLGLLTGMVRRAFGDMASPPKAPETEFDDAAGRARKDARGLLVLVIPVDVTQKFERGRAFGEWLNHGSDAELRPLGQVEVAAATMAEVRRRWPAARPLGEPWMVLIHGNDVQFLDGRVPASVAGRRGDSDDKREEPVIRQRIAALAGMAKQAIGASGGSADEVRARLVKRPVPGSAWASSGGCGTTVEGDEHPQLSKCGMGHVPELSRRFLYFFTKER